MSPASKAAGDICALVIIGAVSFGSIGVFAGQYMATDNPYPIQLNGNEVQIKGYNIDGNTYFQLRNIADVVGGFTVDFNNDTIQLSKDGYVYETPANNLYACQADGFKFNAPVNMTKTEYGDFNYGDCTMSIYRMNKGDSAPWAGEYGEVPITDVQTFEKMRIALRTQLAGQDYEGYIANQSSTHIEASGMSVGQYDFGRYDMNEDDVWNSGDTLSLPHRNDYVERYYIFELNNVFYEIRFYAPGTAWSNEYIQLMNTVINSIEL